jgi:hypothetical protein
VSVAIRREVEGPVYAQANGLQLGLNGKAGVWETFAGTIKATPTVLGPEEMGAYSVFLYNASTGKAWFDSVTIEEEPAR